MSNSVNKINCEKCGRATSAYDGVSYGSEDMGYQLLCNQCFNAEVAVRSGLDEFENIQLEPRTMTDSGGQAHTFHS